METLREPRFYRRLMILVTLLMAYGLVILYSAGQTDVPTAATGAWVRQLVWIGVSVGAAFFVFRMSPRFIESAAPTIYVVSVVLLIVTLIIGTGAGTAAGTRSWLTIWGMRLGQPAELAKLAVIFMLARLLANRRDPPATLVELVPACVVAGIPFVLVSQQPDLGSAIVFIGILFAMLFWAGVSPWLLLFLASPGISLLLSFSTFSWGAWIVVLTAVLLLVRPFLLEALGTWLVNVAMGVVALGLWGLLAPYQRGRLLSFINPEFDPQATGWHLIQSKVAIGSGGILGKGFTDGTQKRLAFLPEQHTDFVFAIVGEEFGFVGVFAAIVLFALLLLALIKVAQTAKDSYSCLAVFGFVGMIFTHIFENIGMTVGLMPITGIPLPFFSYGGSFLLVCGIIVGMAMRVHWDSRFGGYGEWGGG